jgi:quercetin dioxygenase-like cupin family protein
LPIDVRRFGVGHRRPQGPEGTRGVEGVVLHADARGAISELAFARGARLESHQGPNAAWLCVIEGGGWVQVGEEARRVAAGEAVAWPADVPHAAWTDQVPMRALLVELTGADDAWARGILEGRSRLVGPGQGRAADRGEGQLAPKPVDPADFVTREGEPL